MVGYAPIILFIYNRPAHTSRTIKALAKNTIASQSDLFIFSDAPKNDAAIAEVNEVRALIKKTTGFKSVTIIEREVNYGLVKSITEGVTSIINKYGKVIVVEDDLITHKQFLEYLNRSLDLYQDNKEIYEVTGYSHLDSKIYRQSNESYFLKITSTWGWATWADRWAIFGNGLAGSEDLRKKQLQYHFNYDNSYNYSKMLQDAKTGKAKSWGIVWYWNIFKVKGLTLYPTETLVDQIGFDGSGQNAKNYVVSNSRIRNLDYDFVFPHRIEENQLDRKRIINILKKRKLKIVYKIILSKIGLK